jgi:hypothetical protein
VVDVAALVFGLIFVGVCGLCGAQWHALSRARAALREARQALAKAHEHAQTAEKQAYDARADRDALHWHRWWLRNACEGTELDPIRPHLIRYALASLLTDDLGEFVTALHRISSAEWLSEHERQACTAMIGEFRAAIRPWDPRMRCVIVDGYLTGAPEAPEHDAMRLREVQADALQGWAALLLPSELGPAIATRTQAHS